MKISVCGKGGSGKSTIVTLLANEVRTRGYRVLVVDSDESNSGLFRMLGFDKPPVPLMELVGGKKKVQKKMTKGFSSGESETGMRVMMQDNIMVDDIPIGHILKRDNLRLVCIGKILQSLEGCACPMGVLSRELRGKLFCRCRVSEVVPMECWPCMPACPGATGCGYATVFTAYQCLTFHNRILTYQVWARGLGQGILECCL